MNLVSFFGRFWWFSIWYLVCFCCIFEWFWRFSIGTSYDFCTFFGQFWRFSIGYPLCFLCILTDFENFNSVHPTLLLHFNRFWWQPPIWYEHKKKGRGSDLIFPTIFQNQKYKKMKKSVRRPPLLFKKVAERRAPFSEYLWYYDSKS